MHRLLAIFVLTSLSLAMDISVLEKSPNSITIEISISEPSIATHELGGETFQSPHWPDAHYGYDQNQNLVIPHFILPILLPPSGQLPRIQIMDTDLKYDERLSEIKKLPTLNEIKSELSVYKQSQLIHLETSEDFRSYATGRVLISPFANSNQRLSKIIFRLDFESDMGFGSSPEIDLIQGYLNAYMAVNWSKLPRHKLRKSSNNLPSGKWFQIPINDAGIHRISVASFGGSVPDTNPLSWQVYAPFYEGRSLPYGLSNTAEPPPNLKAISMSGTGLDDGSFSGNDRLIFFAQPLNGDFKGDNFTHLYGKQRYYWLCVPENEAPSLYRVNKKTSSSSTPTNLITNYEKRYFHEAELQNQLHSGENWVGEKLVGTSDQLTLLFTDDHLDRNSEIKLDALIVDDYNIWTSGLNLTFEINGLPFTTKANRSSLYRNTHFSGTASETMLQNGTNSIKLNSSNSSASSIIYLDSLRLSYHRLLAPSNDFLFGTLELSGAVNQLDFVDLPGDFHFWDISVPSSVQEWFIENGSFITDHTGKREVIGFSDSQIIQVNLTISSNLGVPSLRNSALQADYIIITPELFMGEAQRIKQLREELVEEDRRLTVEIATIDDIYNEFSAGTQDPAAIKHFLHYVYFHWSPTEPRIRYVLLLGDTDFDYRNITGQSKMLIPTFQQDGVTDVRSYATDDRYTYLASGALDKLPDIAIGRLPAQTPDQLKIMVDKIISYETEPVPGIWRNTVTLVADDPLRPSTYIETEHILDTENTVARLMPNSIYVDKIYLTEYPEEQDPNSPYIKKPRARDDLIKKLYNGTLLVNYLGHGSPNVWAQENVFTSSDLGQVKTGMKLPFWIAGTCDWAKYDDIGTSCVPEELLLMESNGAVGILSATRKTYATFNKYLLSNFFDLLFPEIESSRSITVGEAIMMAKNGGIGSDSNNEKYILLSDPALRLASPQRKGQIQSVSPTSLRAMGNVHYSGITDTSLALGARAAVTVYDTPTPVTRSFNIPNTSIEGHISYVLPGKRIFRGLISVDDQTFTGNFTLPKDIKYTGEGGVLSVQYWDGTGLDGSIYIDTLKFLGTDSTALDDTGPEILFLSENSVLLNGDHFSANEALEAEISDSQGINLTGVAGHGISLAIDEDWDNALDVTELFEYDLDHSDVGRLSAYLTEIPPGEHLISIKAWDSQNNPNEASVRLSFFGADDFRIYDLFNFPNPMIDDTEVTYMLSHPADILFSVYSLAGRKIYSEAIGYQSLGFNSFPWNGRDQYGNRLANGVYIIVLEAENADFKKPGQSLQKLVIAR